MAKMPHLQVVGERKAKRKSWSVRWRGKSRVVYRTTHAAEECRRTKSAKLKVSRTQLFRFIPSNIRYGVIQGDSGKNTAVRGVLEGPSATAALVLRGLSMPI